MGDTKYYVDKDGRRYWATNTGGWFARPVDGMDDLLERAQILSARARVINDWLARLWEAQPRNAITEELKEEGRKLLWADEWEADEQRLLKRDTEAASSTTSPEVSKRAKSGSRTKAKATD